MQRILSVLLMFCPCLVFADVQPSQGVPVKSFDGFALETLVEVPEGQKKEEVKKVVVFAHGSGAQSLDEDLSEISVPKGVKNLVFRDIAHALLKRGIATVRYNKRSYEAKKKVDADPSFKKSEMALKFAAEPFSYLIRDCGFFAEYARKEFPNAEIYLLGHSEGTAVALNAATEKAFIKGTVLIGFYNESIAGILLEQTVYRNLDEFTKLDKNGDGFLTSGETKGKGAFAKALREQISILDRNGDKKISLSEFKAGQYSNLVMRDDLYPQAYLVDEVKRPRPSALVRDARFKVLFLQGEYDNQTPAYYSESIELINRLVWKKKDLKFVYFEKAGHALDPRESMSELSYRQIPTATLTRIAEEVSTF